MQENRLFRKLLRPPTLRVGWHLAHSDSRDDFVSDPVGYQDIAANLSMGLEFLIHELRHDRYRPRNLISVDLPKSGFGIRPGNVLPIEEAALLHSIAYLLAPRLDSHLSSSVYSYRLHKEWRKRVKQGKSLFREGDEEIPFLKGKTIRKIDPFEPWYVAWPEFDRQRMALVTNEGYTHLTRTDISAYFENIDLAVLESLLRQRVPREPILMSLLARLLHCWTRTTSTGVPVGRGIPQGNDVSSFLGNIYLLPLDHALDRYCARRDAVWLRYVDDVEVYSKDSVTAREVISVINGALRQLHLNIQGSKTEIYEGRALSEELSSAELVVATEVCNALQRIDWSSKGASTEATRLLKRVRPIAARFRRGLPVAAHNLNKKDNRLFRRLLTAYGLAHRPYLKNAAIAALEEPPELRILTKCLRYLHQLPESVHAEIVDRLIAIITSTPALISYHSAAILACLHRLHPSSNRLHIVKEITHIGFQQRSDWHVRQRALGLLSVLPAREGTALRRANNSLKHHHPFVRRAAMLMLIRARVPDVRSSLTSLMSDPDPAISRLAVHWSRVLQSTDMAQKVLAGMSRRAANNQNFVWHVPMLYLIRCNDDPSVGKGLRSEVARYQSSKSARVQWHIRRLWVATEWTEIAG